MGCCEYGEEFPVQQSIGKILSVPAIWGGPFRVLQLKLSSRGL
jgi:hypothetical protein